MNQKGKGGRAPKGRLAESTRKIKKKTSILIQEKVDYVDYKDVNLLQRFVSDRSKIKARRVTGNDVQQQRDIAMAIKNARELALIPYAKRVSNSRPGRPDRGERGPRKYEADGASDEATKVSDVADEATDTEESEA
jgi:small subunit ribosomal protein S18